MILGLDISTSITGATVIDENGKVVYNEAWDLRKYKEFFQKAEVIKGKIWELEDTFLIKEIYIEQSLQLKPEYIAATSARKKCGIKVPKGTKAKQVIIQYVLDNVPSVLIEYTKHGNPKPHCFDKADSWVIANAGYICQTEKSAQS